MKHTFQPLAIRTLMRGLETPTSPLPDALLPVAQGGAQ